MLKKTLVRLSLVLALMTVASYANDWASFTCHIAPDLCEDGK